MHLLTLREGVIQLSKIFALYINEMIKITKKVSVIVILILMIVGVVGSGAIIKLVDVYGNSMNARDNSQYMIENTKRNLADNEKALIALEESIKNTDANQLPFLMQEKANLTSQIEMLKIAVDKNIDTSSDNYRNNALKTIMASKVSLNELNSLPARLLTDEDKKMIVFYDNIIPRLNKIIDNKDFKEYINIKNDEINNDSKTSPEEKKIYIESNALRLKLNLTGDDNSIHSSEAQFSLTQVENAKRSLLSNLDYTNNQGYPTSLTPESREKITNDLAVNMYKLENNILTSQNNNSGIAIMVMLSIGNFMIIILMMILAGGAVSQEMSSGSIKSLIISPAKRWKIFTAKVLSLLTMGITATVVLYIFSMVTNGLLFGFGSGLSYVYATNGITHEFNFYLYELFYVFIDFVGVIVYMMFALMLSVITRNTAVAVGISIALFFTGSTASAIISQLVKGEWLKFIPFNNLGLTTRIFPNNVLAQASGAASASPLNISVNFSLCYLAVILICMSYIALDSFNRRDIK